MKLFEALDRYNKVRKKNWEKGRYLTRNKWGDVVDERGEDWLFNPRLIWDEWEEYRDILSNEEKTYLSAFFAPLKKQYSRFTICKLISNCNLRQKPEYKDMLEVLHTDLYKTYYCKYEFIQIVFGNKVSCGVLDLPNFPKGKYYKGLELNKQYELEELGL